jgi:serine/threonine protein phosphatase PrpC
VASDRGRVHRRNEDAFFLQLAGRGGAAVVCDGISSASAGNVAARRAADVAGSVLIRSLAAEPPDLPLAMRTAAEAAQDAVASVPWTTRIDRDAPSCTLVAALWHEAEIAIGWLGDSRAYWVDGDGARPLTRDDSWAEEQAAARRLPVEQARRDPRAHAITQWVGADAPVRAPHVAVLRAPGRGRLLLCTDGLWNYAPTPAHITELVQALPPTAAPAAVARALTDTAIMRGGRDNVTVAVVDIDIDIDAPARASAGQGQERPS